MTEGISVNTETFNSNSAKKKELANPAPKCRTEKQMEKICVAVRVRPLVSEDSINGSFWKVEDNRISLHRIHGTPFSGSSYAFGTYNSIQSSLSISCSSYFFNFNFRIFSDHIFDESSTNSSVYELLTKDIILAALNGFNGIQIQTIILYFGSIS